MISEVHYLNYLNYKAIDDDFDIYEEISNATDQPLLQQGLIKYTSGALNGKLKLTPLYVRK